MPLLSSICLLHSFLWALLAIPAYCLLVLYVLSFSLCSPILINQVLCLRKCLNILKLNYLNWQQHTTSVFCTLLKTKFLLVSSFFPSSTTYSLPHSFLLSSYSSLSSLLFSVKAIPPSSTRLQVFYPIIIKIF